MNWVVQVGNGGRSQLRLYATPGVQMWAASAAQMDLVCDHSELEAPVR